MSLKPNWKFIGSFIKADIGFALVVALSWQLLMTGFGVLADYSFSGHQAAGITVTPFTHTAVWDAGWYEGIVNGSYKTNPGAPVFYPMFPLLVVIVKFLSFGTLHTYVAGALINTICIWFAVLALVKISDFFLEKKYRWLMPILFLTSPAAIFLHMFYAEAVFCAIAFWAYLFALRRQWHWMAIVLALLTAVRLPALLFIGLCALEYLRAYQWRLKKALNPRVLWFALAPLGFIAYATYLHFVTGDSLAMIHGYKRVTDWSYHVFNLNVFYTARQQVGNLLYVLLGRRPFSQIFFINNVLPLACLVALFAASAYALFTHKLKDQLLVPLGVFGIVSMFFFSLNSNIISVHRYILPCIVVYVSFLMFITRQKRFFNLIYPVIYVGIMLQAYIFILFVSGRFAG